MTDQQTTSVVEANIDSAGTIDSEIVAEVAWTVASRPPEVALSFQGLAEPVELFASLRAIGWEVPNMPPRPANAIDWTPDPVAGTDYTVLPWRVTEFQLVEGTWTIAPESVGTRTLDALLDNGAQIDGTSDQIREHAATYVPRTPQPAAQPEQQTHTVDVATSDYHAAPAATSYRTIILLGFPTAEDPLPGAGTWVGISGRQKVQCTWNEHAISSDQPVPGLQTMATHVATGALALVAETPIPLPETADAGHRIVRFVLPDTSINDRKVRRLNKLLGDNIETHELRSLTSATTTAVLVSATVNANAFEMLKANLCLRLPAAVIRVPATTVT